MNVNITGVYDNSVIVDNNLFEDVRLLQTGLSSLKLAPKRVSHWYMIKSRYSQSIHLRYMHGCSWESNPTNPPAGERHGCRWVPFNTVQTVVQTGSKYAWMVSPWRFTRLLGRLSSTAVLGPFDSSRRTPPWRFTPERWMIGTESLRWGGKTETLTQTGHVSSGTWLWLHLSRAAQRALRPGSLLGPGGYTPRVWGPYCVSRCPHGLSSAGHVNLHE